MNITDAETIRGLVNLLINRLPLEENREIKIVIIKLLAKIKNERAVPTLIKLLEVPDEELRLLVVKALMAEL